MKYVRIGYGIETNDSRNNDGWGLESHILYEFKGDATARIKTDKPKHPTIQMRIVPLYRESPCSTSR